MGKKPPKTRRYCVVCKKETTFEYNPCIGHSECKECGSRWALRAKPIDEIKEEELSPINIIVTNHNIKKGTSGRHCRACKAMFAVDKKEWEKVGKDPKRIVCLKCYVEGK